ncbi:IS3 family transposase [Acinetobacter baumannii]|uniref:IS3 family transposase n=1 Tax=Acinetobacter baumannii TaxID=470 RepID=UPI0029416F19|nr:IS3 family transposase [Acinetobacter baumannii]MDV4273816.1 IS3 family transposase [Acinetobacter baumannii]
MTKAKRKFDANYKLHICELTRKQGLTITQVCTDNSLGQSTVHRWLNQYDAELQGKAGIGLPITPEQRRIRELELENKRLRGDVDILKKGYDLLHQANSVDKSKLIQQCPQHSIQRVCKLLMLNRSSLYRHKKSKASKTSEAHQALIERICSLFNLSGKNYGSRRIQRALLAEGICVGRYKVRRIMRKQGLVTTWRRKFIKTTNSRHNMKVAENILNQKFNPTEPNKVWVADITYIRTARGWLYLAAVMDLYSRKIVGYSLSHRMTADLVCTALQVAIHTRQPPKGLIMHTDRGSQYCSVQYQDLLSQYGLHCSMSHKGLCYDNAVMERFFLNLKMERVWQKHYTNHQEAIRDVSHYITVFYNQIRLHSTLGYLSPNNYEQKVDNISIPMSDFT